MTCALWRTPDEPADEAKEQPPTLERVRYRNAGLLPFAAFLNPSGNSNVERCFISDAQILRAYADLPAAAAGLPTLYVWQADAAAATS
jgi:hypothetical protein